MRLEQQLREREGATGSLQEQLMRQQVRWGAKRVVRGR